MENIYKVLGIAFISVITTLCFGKGKTSFAVSAFALVSSIAFVIINSNGLLKELPLNTESMTVITKGVGISVLSGVASEICLDAGDGNMGFAVSVVCKAEILYLCIEPAKKLLKLAEDVL